MTNTIKTITIATIVTIALIISLGCMIPACAESYDLDSIYPRTAVVTDLDYDEDLVICTDSVGFDWVFEGIEDWSEGDVVSLLMWDADTPDSILDDVILKAYYGGWFGMED